MNIKNDFLKLLTALLVLSGLLLVERTAFAASVFGGRILSIINCHCPPGARLIHVGPPRAKSLMYIPGKSRVYAYGSINTGRWVLGIDSSSQTCFISSFLPCDTPIGTGNVILKIGTSK